MVFMFLVVIGKSSGDLRLDNYYSNDEGRLEVYQHVNYRIGYLWMPFRINSLSMYGADLACKKLGYSHASRYATVGTLG